jgi:hypothetical protein
MVYLGIPGVPAQVEQVKSASRQDFVAAGD